MTDRFAGPHPVGGNGVAADRWQPQAPLSPGSWPPPPRLGQSPTMAPPPPAAPVGGNQQPPERSGWPSSGTPPALHGPPPQWMATPPVPKSRKPLWVTLAAGGAVIVVVVIVLVITLAGRGGGAGGGSAGDVVKGYLQALARGDAEAALSYGADQPASKEFLTDDILRKQIAHWPISNIRILSDDSTGGALGFGAVHVVVNFGDKPCDTTLHLKKDHGRWKLDAAAIKLSPDHAATMGNAAAKTLTFFGKPVAESTVYVFPGWIDVGTTNPYLTATAKPMLLEELSLLGLSWMQPTFELKDSGRTAARDQLSTALGVCARSNLLAPPGCPLDLDPYGLTEGTVAWGVADASAVKFDQFDPYRLVVTFFGEVKVPITVQTRSGATKTAMATQFLSGTADIAKTPPALSFR